MVFSYGWGIGIRTPTNRVRVCRATVTQFPKIGNMIIISDFFEKSSTFLQSNKLYGKKFTIDEIIGKTVIIHAKPDDFITQPSGNAGEKIACGVISGE